MKEWKNLYRGAQNAMKNLSIDIETYSDQNLAKTGVYRYVESPVFQILLFSYSVDGDPVQLIDLACGEEIPADMREKAEEYRAAMIESICETDEDLFMKYCEGEEISIDELKAALRTATLANKIVPVVCGTSYRNKGVQKLLDAIIDYMILAFE